MAVPKRVAKSDQFWADAQQASERIQSSYILLDGLPVYVERVYNGVDTATGNAQARINKLPNLSVAMVDLKDKRFGKFRRLPLLGWVNISTDWYTGAVYFSRRARNMRAHGLNHNNTTALRFYNNGSLQADREYNMDHYVRTQDYVDAHTEKGYPTLDEILGAIQPGTSIALSPLFAVYMCDEGVRWLYRKKSKIGFFPGIDSLSLFPSSSFYREEIMDDERFTITKIQEF